MDVVVLGSGAAGLAAALAVRPVRSVLVVTKDVLNAGSTGWAQGGLAAVLAPTDTFEDHVRDTLAAGAGGGFTECRSERDYLDFRRY